MTFRNELITINCSRQQLNLRNHKLCKINGFSKRRIFQIYILNNQIKFEGLSKNNEIIKTCNLLL